MVKRGALIAAGLLLLGGLVPTRLVAEKVQEGDLIATFDGGISPSTLPRRTRAPVAVSVAGNFINSTRDAARLPQLRRISVAINRQGHLFDRGLATCSVKEIQPATEAAARRICGDAIVGSGHVVVQVRLETQPPFLVRARLLAFNGPWSGGTKRIFAQAYGLNPPGAFVLPFRVRRTGGTFGTVLTTTLPKSARGWAYLTHFDMKLQREYNYDGRRRSFVSAACSAPAGFDLAVFPFARTSYRFDDGRNLEITTARTCRVARGT